MIEVLGARQYLYTKRIDFVEQVLAEEGKAKAIAFEEIDKAPEEKKRGITIATVRDNSSLSFWKSILKLCHSVICSCIEVL